MPMRIVEHAYLDELYEIADNELTVRERDTEPSGDEVPIEWCTAEWHEH